APLDLVARLSVASLLMRKITFLVLLSIVTALCLMPAAPGAFAGLSPQTRSRVIVGAAVIDGSGRPRFKANVRIEGDVIAEVGAFAPRAGEEIIEARGMVVAPGFVDIHNHSETGLTTQPAAATQVSQGITTLAVGPDGDSPWPIADYLAKLNKQRAAVNVLAFVGHATVREMVMKSDYNRAATEKEVGEMARLVEQAMSEGAFGLSTGLEYDVGHASTTEEVIALARVAARHGGIYMSHIRDEADLAMAAFEEAIRIGREARVPVQISHIKLGTVGVWGRAKKVVAMINAARRKGLDVTADCYPYDAWASTITVLIPSRRHDDPKAVAKGLADVGGAGNVLITNSKAHADYEGKTLEEIARERNMTPVNVYIQIVKDGGASVVCRSMIEPDIKTFYTSPWVMVASDGGIGGRHPRAAGTFPRVLGRFAREKRWLTLEEAVRKMTSAPASRLGLADRGLIRKGMKADLVIFDPARVIDRSTFKEPQLLSVGIERVLVNGEAVWEQGKTTGRLPGVAIRKAGANESR
ncbi:MAG TPA: D-aminoacylase, partial [Blastocatellia bacterium]|nr:D-aminoacylase [Blastocatellia bacterium]